MPASQQGRISGGNDETLLGTPSKEVMNDLCNKSQRARATTQKYIQNNDADDKDKTSLAKQEMRETL